MTHEEFYHLDRKLQNKVIQSELGNIDLNNMDLISPSQKKDLDQIYNSEDYQKYRKAIFSL